jgi:2-methylcitrate dehydratase PrpD
MTKGTKAHRTAITVAALARATLTRDTRAIVPEAIRQARLPLLNTIGCARAGAREGVARSVAEVAVRGALPECALTGRTSNTELSNAVLANGTAVRVLDLNDHLINESKVAHETGGHPSHNIPVALAVGTAFGRSGADILGRHRGGL